MSTPAHSPVITTDGRLDAVTVPVDAHSHGVTEEGITVGRMDVGGEVTTHVGYDWSVQGGVLPVGGLRGRGVELRPREFQFRPLKPPSDLLTKRADHNQDVPGGRSRKGDGRCDPDAHKEHKYTPRRSSCTLVSSTKGKTQPPTDTGPSHPGVRGTRGRGFPRTPIGPTHG